MILGVRSLKSNRAKPQSRPVIQDTEIDLAPGSYLEYMPDSIIAYHDARYREHRCADEERLGTDAGSCYLGLSALVVPGFSLRVLGSSTQQIEQVFEQCRQFIREQWLGVKTVSFRKY